VKNFVFFILLSITKLVAMIGFMLKKVDLYAYIILYINDQKLLLFVKKINLIFKPILPLMNFFYKILKIDMECYYKVLEKSANLI